MVRERRGAPGATLSTDFEIQNVRVLASHSALVESFNRALLSGRSLVFSYGAHAAYDAWQVFHIRHMECHPFLRNTCSPVRMSL